MVYEITYREILDYSYDVEAESQEEAEAEFYRMLENSELDLTHGYLEESFIHEIKEA